MKRIVVTLDQGLAIAYFLETDLTRQLLDKGAELIFLVQEAMLPLMRKDYQQPGVTFESMRDQAAQQYAAGYAPGVQELLDYVRRASASNRMLLTYVDTHRRRKEREAAGRRQKVLLGLRPLIYLLRRSKPARWAYRKLLDRLFTPHLYDDLFERTQPDLLVCNTAGWRLDQYLLREATRRGIRTATVIVGWDNPSSQGLPGAFIEYVNVWSEMHRREMVEGIDWPAEKVHVGGMPLYDGYINRRWAMSREAYFKLHGLDPDKKLVAFAATALSISPNLHIIKELAEMIGKQQLSQPAQLLIRLHPNHFKPFPHYQQEAKAIYELAKQYPDVHVVEPKEVAPGAGLERYSGEDFPEKGSMLANCDVLVTIYSTMVVEAALHDKPFISACIDTAEGWPGKFWIPLHEVPDWPTARRVNAMHAGRTVLDAAGLRQSLDAYLADPGLDRAERRRFVESELTYVQGEATAVTANFLWQLAEKK